MTSLHVPPAPHAAAPAPAPAPESLDTLARLAGRQRMLSQRVVLHTVLAAHGDLGALTTAQEALELLRFSHRRLLAAPALHDALHGPRGAHGPAEAFMQLAEETLSAIAQSLPGTARRVSSLVGRAGPVLGVLNDLTQLCEQRLQAQLRAGRERRGAHRQEIERLIADARAAARVAGEAGDDAPMREAALRTLDERLDALGRGLDRWSREDGVG